MTKQHSPKVTAVIDKKTGVNGTIKEVDIVKAPDINIVLEYLKGLYL